MFNEGLKFINLRAEYINGENPALVLKKRAACCYNLINRGLCACYYPDAAEFDVISATERGSAPCP